MTKKPNKKINNGLIVMSKGERIGVISLLSVITLLLAFSVFRPAIKFSRQEELAHHNLDSMIALQQKVSPKEETVPVVQNSSAKPSTKPTSSTKPSEPKAPVASPS